MPWVRPPRLQSEYGLRMIRQIAGTSKPIVVLLTLVVVLSSGVSGNALWGILQWAWAKGAPGDFSWLAHLSGLLAFPAVVLGLWLWGKSASEHVRVAVIQDEEPQRVKALILFLGPPRVDTGVIDHIVQNDPGYRLNNKTDREQLKGPWRMPLEAIAYHVDRLRYVVVIPSADSANTSGTHHDAKPFVALIERLLEPAQKARIEVLDLNTLLRRYLEEQDKERASHRNAVYRFVTLIQESLNPSRSWPIWQRLAKWGGSQRVVTGEIDYSQGVDYESTRSLVDAVELAYELLRTRIIPPYEILIDVTSGQKPPTVAGAIVSLAEGRRFQYVSTNDYKVQTYDVTYLT